MSDFVTRRKLLLAMVLSLPAGRPNAGHDQLIAESLKSGMAAVIGWPEFEVQMASLSEARANDSIAQKTLSASGIDYLKRLDIKSAEFKQAVEFSYETGNRYWLWQRMIKTRNLNGGILTIRREQAVQLHDHPGATGLLRVLSGRVEVWQFDEMAAGKGVRQGPATDIIDNTGEMDEVELLRVSHRVLKPGDTALLTPDRGNIHALQALTPQCRMLDFFIPPYARNRRSWYEPQQEDWFSRQRPICRKVPQHAYDKA